MVNADGNLIPLVEGDQGEGIKDFLDEAELNKSTGQRLEELAKRISLKETLEKGKNQNEMLQLILEKIEVLERRIDLIFGAHVLINGHWFAPINKKRR